LTHTKPGSPAITYGRTFSGSAHSRGPGHSRAACRPRPPRSISNRTSKCTDTVTLNLARFDRQDWLPDDATMDAIAAALDTIRKVPVITPRQTTRLLPVDPLTLQAGLLGSNPNGLFKL